MLDVTPQERLALIVIAALIVGGALARHAVFTARADGGLAFSAEAADSINADGGSGLRRQVSAEVERQKVRETPLAAGERIDPNTAAAEQLDRLPRIGPALADRIVAFRAAGGRFRTAEDMRQVSGIGPALLVAIEPYLDLSRAPPVLARIAPTSSSRTSATQRSPATSQPRASVASSAVGSVRINSATAEQLQTLPGVGPVIAERIVEHRRVHGPFRSFEDLEDVSGVGPRLRERLQATARLGT